jgi:mono/diheme cytochrome c family protein
MSMVLALLAAAGVVGGLSGCATGKASLPTADALGAAGALPRGTDMDALQRGRAILVTECANCHRLFLPAEYSPEQWGGIVKRMANRASLGEDQAADLELYLAVSSRAGK